MQATALNLTAHQILPGLPFSNQCKLVAAHQDLRRKRSRIVIRSHHKSVRARAHDRQQIALVQFGDFPIQCKVITGLAHRPNNVDLPYGV